METGVHRIYSAAVIFIITIITIIFGFIINTTTSESVSDKIQSAERYAENNDAENANKQIKAALSEWESKMETMLIFISHGKLDQIEESLHTANTYLEFGELKSFTAECRKTEILLKHFNDLEYPTINNIL